MLTENYWVYRLGDDGRLMCVASEEMFLGSLKFYPADFDEHIYVLVVETRVMV